MHMIHPARFRRSGPQAGYTIIEFMIASTISLVVLAAMTAAFVSSMRGQTEMGKSNQRLEGGRVALQMVTEDLQLAGYYGELDMMSAEQQWGADPAALPDPCATTLPALQDGMRFPVQGLDNVTNGSGYSCLSNVKSGTDVVVVRRVSTCQIAAGLTDSCDSPAISGAPYFQASSCSDAAELLHSNPKKWYAVDTLTSNLTLRTRACTNTPPDNSPAPIRRFRVHIYYIRDFYRSGDGIPTLMLAELRGNGFVHYPLAYGVDFMHLEYGVDDDGDGDIDNYNANPATYNGCAAADCAVTNWRNASSVMVRLVVRSLDEDPFYTARRFYYMGVKASGNTIESRNIQDGYKRNSFNSVVRLNNIVLRRR